MTDKELREYILGKSSDDKNIMPLSDNDLSRHILGDELYNKKIESQKMQEAPLLYPIVKKINSAKTPVERWRIITGKEPLIDKKYTTIPSNDYNPVLAQIEQSEQQRDALLNSEEFKNYSTFLKAKEYEYKAAQSGYLNNAQKHPLLSSKKDTPLISIANNPKLQPEIVRNHISSEQTKKRIQEAANTGKAQATNPFLNSSFNSKENIEFLGNPDLFAKEAVLNFQVTEKWSNDAIQTLLKLYKIDPENALNYAANVNYKISLQETEQFGEEHPVLASIGSVPINVLSGIEQVANLTDYLDNDMTEMRRNTSADTASALRRGVSKRVDWNIGDWDAFDFIYNTGMSAVDSLSMAPLGGAGSIMLGLQAAAHTTNDILDRGGTNEQAFFGGLAAGTFEAIFEKISIGNFNSLKEVSPQSFKDVLKNIAKAMGVNASEEAATETANILYDTFVNGDVSNYALMVKNYMEQFDMSESAAKAKVAWDLALQVIESGASGALMGFGFGTIGSAQGYAYNKAIQKANTPTDNTTGEREYSIELDSDGNTYVQVNEDIFAENDGKSVASIIANVISTKFNNLITANGQNIQINKTTNDEWRYSKKSQELYGENPTAFNDKLKTIANADEILKVAKGWIGEEIGHNRTDDIVEFARGFINYKVGDNGYSADVLVGIRKNGAAVLYDLVNIYEKQITAASVATTKASNNSLRTPNATVTGNNIPQPAQVVNTNSSPGKSLLSEPDLTASAPKTAEQLAMEQVAGVDSSKTDGQRRVETIARILKQRVEWYESDDVTDRGYYENGVIYINKKANQAYTVIFTHEFLHHLQTTKVYKKFVEFVKGTQSYKNWIAAQDGYDAFAADIKQKYERRKGKIMSPERLDYEIMARFISEGFFTEANLSEGGQGYNFLTEIAENHHWYNRVMDWIKEMINRLRHRNEQADFIKMQRLLKAAYSQAQSRTVEQSGTKEHSVSKSFSEELQSWFDTTTPDERKVSGKRFLVGTTTDVLKSIGVKDYAIYFGGSKINKILTDNASMSLDIIKQSVNLLEEPILIMKSQTVEDSIVIFGEVFTEDNKPVMISVLLNPKTKNGEILDYAVITSAYGRRSNNLQNLLNKSEIYYINEQKNRTDKWLKALGLQLPSALTKYGSINSIPNSSENVNTNSSTRENSIDINEQGEVSYTPQRYIAPDGTERIPPKLYARDLLSDEGSTYSREQLGKQLQQIYEAADKGHHVEAAIMAEKAAANILDDVPYRDFSQEGENAADNATRALADKIMQHVKEGTSATINRMRGANKKLEQRIQKTEDKNAKLESTINTMERERENIRKEERAKAEAAQQRKTDRNAVIKSVNRLDKKFRANSNSKHVHKDLKSTVKLFLEIFLNNTPQTFEDRNVHKLRTIYNRFVKNQTDLTLDPDTEEKINYLAEIMDGKSLSDLSNDELKVVRELAEHFEHLVTTANEIFLEGRKEDFRAIANEEAERLKQLKDKKEIGLGKGKIGKAFDEIKEFLIEGNLKPVYFFEKIGGVYKKLFDGISEGMDKTINNINKTKDMLQKAINNYNYWSWVDKNQKIELGHPDGQKITLTIGEAMSVLATYKRERSNKDTQDSNHLSQGGIVLKTRQIVEQIENEGKAKNGSFDKLMQRYLVSAWASSPYRINEADIRDIRKQLGKDKEAFVDELVNIMSTFGAELGNKASNELYGYSKFGEPYYFPYETSNLFLARELDKKQAHKTIAGKSFAKNTVEAANTPLVITDFMEVFCKHMTEMCEYNGLLIPLNNLERITKFTERADNNKAAFSLINELNRAYGAAAVNYLNKFIDDVNGGIAGQHAGDNVASSLISLFQKNAVAANMSVTIQQPSSIARILPYLEYKYLKAGMGTITGETWNECKKYCPIAIQKEMGRFDIGNPKSTFDYMMNRQYSGIKDKAKGFFKDENYRDNIMSLTAAKADQFTWSIIWNGCKAKVQATTNLTGEDLKNEAAKLFKEVVEHTQVYDSVLSRSQNMRSKSVWTRMATAFMGEPTTNLNMLHKMVWDFKSGDRKSATKCVIGVLSATLLNSILKSLVTAMRDDDEDKSYGEKYITEVGGNFMSDINPAGWIPLVSDAVSAFEGYQVKRADMEIVQDLYYGLKSLSSSEKTTWEKILAVANPISALCGIPVENVARDIGAFVKTASQITSDNLEHTHGAKFAFKEGFCGEKTYAEYYELLRDYQHKGKVSKYKELREYLLGRGKTEKEIDSGVKSAYKKSKDVAKQSADYFERLHSIVFYDNLSEEKQKAVQGKIKSYLADKAMAEDTGKEMSSTNKKAEQAEEKGSSAAMYFLARAGFEDKDKSGGISKEEKIGAINKMNISSFEKAVLISLYT